MTKLTELGKRARAAESALVRLGTEEKNRALRRAAELLLERTNEILAANAEDMQRAREKGLPPAMLDRLLLDEARVQGMAGGLKELSLLPDPIGELLSEETLANGLVIRKKRVALGVIGIIYEARPNVTSDAFGIAFKAGNAVILRGGSDAISSNRAIAAALREGLMAEGITEDALQLIEDTSRESARELMHMNGYVDVLIPRGSAGLIQTVLRESAVPVIETGAGNCHIYVDDTADLELAIPIIVNAKTQRIGVCNAAESLLVHRSVEKEFLPRLRDALKAFPVEVRADETARALEPSFAVATEEDWGREYLDYILSLKTMDSVDEAIGHINRYHTGHSDAIITRTEEHAERFLREVDSACVYVNASTRFTDGGEFGFGAEIGISTQKLHARGPMGLKELTSYKYEIRGQGQIRD
ncbi:glutamate-5-semialdehyde dehydrogenase [Fusobacterium naviforme]|nr:glutamate-5-semialdehyde dehydrogenase [Fusobacterium naviforme]PSL10726.1 glutamate-5-semialdehyde dehydrogenase [Fusobacterium naviforme]STO27275.1 Gamma-glutamyl phosphate reductase [Fusobacterium naviforme]